MRQRSVATTREDAPPWFRAGMLLLPLWIVCGAYFDTWAHHHSTLTTIWTVPHGVVFTGLGAAGAFMAVSLYRIAGGIGGMLKAIPRGYGLAVAGFVITLTGGVGDLIWHAIFGVDQGFGSVTSPTHIMTGAGLCLMATGPLREAWSGTARRITWSALASGTLVLAMIFFFDEATHPFLAQWASRVYPGAMLPEQAEQLGTVEVAIWAAIIVGFILPLVLRFELPFGALTVVLGVTGIMTTLIVAPHPVLAVGVVGGLVADELIRALRPSRARRLQVRGFAAAVPSAMALTYFFVLSQAGGVWWPANIWAGSVVAAGIVGVLVSLLILPALKIERPAA
ncbi:MAG TPA: hypothetical protein VG329_10355 [Candidatus Dormibacteraeota bacterium]|nr:hypothetical protein [Candidatus Dormibacteraeota bacterium]